MSSNAEFIVSIDFGSTFTKVHHTISEIQAAPHAKQSVVHLCKFGNYSGSRNAPLVPSIIQYDLAGNVVGWGYDPIVKGAVQIRGIKLCLPHEDDVTWDPTTYPVVAHANQCRKNLRKTVLMVITDFMTRLWQVCRPQINTNNQPGMNWRLIITHPHGWGTDKLEQAIDAAIVKPDHGNGTYTICFQTEAEAALIAVLADRGNQGDHEGNGQPPASYHRPGGQVAQAQDGETVVVLADFGGLTVDIASGRVNTQASITSLTEQAAPTSQIYGPSLLNNSFMSLLVNKVEMLLSKPQIPDWYFRGLKEWEKRLLPRLAPGPSSDLTFSVAIEDFKKSTWMTHNRWAQHGELPIHSVEIESMMDYHIKKVTAAIEKQIKDLRGLGYTANYLCLTGGFSLNTYVGSQLKQLASTAQAVSRSVRNGPVWSGLKP
ncbi:hypothetical protein F5B18DRAFT_657826 [Nemania serpens]|nr:hypothetical protein F5B18DRAFT_657826 [Nemania serpens]